MARITVSFDVPELLREHFVTTDLDPFENNLSVKVDRDNLTVLLQDLMQEVRYQKQRDNETLQGSIV